MYLNQFSVRVPEGNEKSSGYVELEHGTQYTIMLRNNRSVRCDAEVKVDGKHIGTFRLSPYSNLKLERPGHDDGKFTFYKADSAEGRKVNAGAVAQSDKGLISVAFTPEVKRVHLRWNPPWHDWCDQYGWTPTEIGREWTPTRTHRGTYDSNTTADVNYAASISHSAIDTQSCVSSENQNYDPGVTGLSGKSGQKFVTVGPMELDYCQRTVINLRLVVPEQRDEPRPLAQMSNPVPPAVR